MEEDILSPIAITANLGTHFIGQRVIYYPKLGSTMDEARRQAKQQAGEGTVIIAEEQTAGRGRSRRAWLSPKGNIALSIILYPELAHLPSLIMVASLGVAHAIKRVTGLDAELKWPNDVLINNKKVCGILIESELKGKRTDYAIIGIGINVNFKPSDFPELTVATSLAEELGRGVSRPELVRCLLTEIERLYLALPSGDLVYREWRDRLVTLGKEVQVSSGGITYKGIAEAVASDGSLLLRQPDGSSLRIVAGDVTLQS